MGVRKNAKFLNATERENFVKACVLMKADIVNPGAPAANRYSKWDELVAIHRMIQDANAPGTTNVNFGHGGTGAFSFLSWHRYFLYLFEVAYVGTDVGVFRTVDGGETWTAFQDGLPRSPVTELKFNRRYNRLFAGTMGRGVYVRDV